MQSVTQKIKESQYYVEKWDHKSFDEQFSDTKGKAFITLEKEQGLSASGKYALLRISPMEDWLLLKYNNPGRTAGGGNIAHAFYMHCMSCTLWIGGCPPYESSLPSYSLRPLFVNKDGSIGVTKDPLKGLGSGHFEGSQGMDNFGPCLTSIIPLTMQNMSAMFPDITIEDKGFVESLLSLSKGGSQQIAQ